MRVLRGTRHEELIDGQPAGADRSRLSARSFRAERWVITVPEVKNQPYYSNSSTGSFNFAEWKASPMERIDS
jgi:hypothetical protein